MSRIEAKLLDIVRLRDGQEGTIVDVYEEPPGYEVEITAEELTLVTISASEIVEVIWKAP